MARALGTERGQAFLEVGRVVQADVLRQREADLGGALRQGVEAMEVVRDAPARPLGQAVGEVRVVVAVLTVGAEAGVDRGDRAIDRRHGGKIAIRALAQGLLRNRQDLLQDRASSEEHTSELQSLMRISYAVFCLKK